MIRSFFVSQEICEWLHLSNYWTIFEKFSLDIFFLNSNTVIIYFPNITFDSAFVYFKMLDFTFRFLSTVFHAFLFDKSFLLTEVKNFINISTFTSKLICITINDFLSTQLDSIVVWHANLILNHWKSSKSIRRWTIEISSDVYWSLNAMWILLSPVILFWKFNFHLF